jgi:crossover junction endodeoxyribonuclease RusA
MLKIKIPWPPKYLSPNSRVHWAKKAKSAKKYKADCFFLAKNAGLVEVNSKKIDVHIDFYAPDKRRRDIDNLIASIKNGLDGIADAIKVDDHCFVIAANLNEKIVKNGIIEVSIIPRSG